LNGLKCYGYAGIDDSSKVHHLLKGIKTTKLDVCSTQVVASPNLRDDFAAAVELHSTFLKQMKADNPQLNASAVSFARGTRGWGNNPYGKRGSSGISNVSNAEQNNTLRLNHL
jgi:hypothetical protein